MNRLSDGGEVTMNKAADSSRLQSVIQKLFDSETAKEEKRLTKEKELAAIKVSKEDVALIDGQLELPKGLSERFAKEHGGDVSNTLRAMMGL